MLEVTEVGVDGVAKARTMYFVQNYLLESSRECIKQVDGAPSKWLKNLEGQMMAWVLEFGAGRVSVPYGEWCNHETTRSMDVVISKIPVEERACLEEILGHYYIATSLDYRDPVSGEKENIFPHCQETSLDYPTNIYGLSKGSRIIADQDLFLSGLPFLKGDILELAYDGSKIRCQSFSWDFLILQQELLNGSNWSILKH